MFNALEIDFLPVGEGKKSGDAIALRFGNYENSKWKDQRVFIIDGGNLASGDALVTHVNEIYMTDTVDRVILTHPDVDHASGLRTVVENLNVGKIWMHRPWNHWHDLKDSIKDGRITKASFNERLTSAYQFAYEIEQIANKKKIEIFAPHQGNSYAIDNEPILKILGPGKEFYLSLLQASEKTPHMHGNPLLEKAFSEKAKKKVTEDMRFETEHLCDSDDTTSPENDMSLILYLTVAGKKILFTGDAGTMGLYKAIYYAKTVGIDLTKLDRFQIPHHGSVHNLSKGILKNIKAPASFISCSAKGEPRHPSGIVTNALHRRNINAYQTKGSSLRYHTTNVPREGMVPAIPVPFQSVVEIPAE